MCLFFIVGIARGSFIGCFPWLFIRLKVLNPYRAREASDKIDTWEDLLEAGDKPPSNLQAPSSKVGPAVDGGCRGGITRTSFLHAVKLVHAGKIR